MKILELAIVSLALSGPVYIDRNPAGGLIVTSPGSSPYRPPAYIQPVPGPAPSWIVTQPGSSRAPIYVYPNSAGRGLILIQPGGK